MKKENRKAAQEQRAKERRKQLFKNKLKKILCIAIPAIAILALIIVLIVDSRSSSDDDTTSGSDSAVEDTTDTNTSDDDTADEDTADEDAAAYSTDTSLTVADGDTVNIDFVGSIDGVEFDGGSSNGYGYDLVIGSGSFIDDFEEQLIGSHPGDIVEVNVTFPEDYGSEDLNGKDAVFEVTINGIYE